MDDDWDLHAVVKGFAAAGTTINTANNRYFPSSSSSSSSLPLPFHNDQSSFDFPSPVDGRNDSFQGLYGIYQESWVDPPPSAAATISTPATQVFQPETVSLQPPPQMNMQMQENLQLTNLMLMSSPLSFPVTNPQPIGPRKKKTQQMKMVHQVTEEQLSADSWAWRKYGQKHIKGSPHQRNYYRCNTSKGCAARKQVERSSDNPEIFLVTYSGEHTHPRPTNRNSLAGNTRTANNKNKAGSVNSSSPTLSSSSFYPIMEDGSSAQKNDMEMGEAEDGGGDEDTNVTIPNDFVHDENRFNGSDNSSGSGGNLYSSSFMASPFWN